MKQFVLYFVLAIIGVLTVTQCTCSKPVFKQNPPFSISNSHYQDWVGGIPGVSGTLVHINLLTIEEDVRPDSLFFRQRKVKIDSKTAETGFLWVANFRTNLPRDINMHSDPQEEYGNTAPSKEVFPFELTENEAVISYYLNEKHLYYKITDLQKKETQFFPSTKPKNSNENG